MLLPVGIILLAMFNPSPEIWRHLWATRLPEMARNTFVALVGVAVGTFILGVGLAWLVVAYEFPGRRWLEGALILPLAIPAYIQAFVFMVLFDQAGPVQQWWRAWFGPEAWFPPIRSGGGVILVMSLVFYPYVYLLARAAFHEQAARLVDVARTLGYTRGQAFWRLILPMARPSVAAGLTLALMEVLTDVGTVRFLNFPTFSDGIFRIWHGMMAREAALGVAGLLLVTAVLVMGMERRMRGRIRYVQPVSSPRGMMAVPLSGIRGWLATAVCLTVLVGGFILPIGQLIAWASQEVLRRGMDAELLLYIQVVQRTVLLATVGTVVTVGLALVLASGVRFGRQTITRWAARGATLGYAVPAAVVALGVLYVLTAADRGINSLARAVWGVPVGLLLTGSIVGLIYAYAARFMAVAYLSLEASLEKITPAMEETAQTLGTPRHRVVTRVYLPLIRAGGATAALVVFVEIVKELPATLLLRPFGYDTLALRVWQEVTESLWENAALPALTIVLVGLIPVFWLIRLATAPIPHRDG